MASSVVVGRRYDLSMSLIDRAEARRKSALAAMDPAEQAALGQYFTAYKAAPLTAGLPRVPGAKAIRVLDPRAGGGMLTAALVDRIHAESPDAAIDVVAVEAEAWCASDPTHMIHLNGDKFLGPHTAETS